ncbi:hypothetical protein H0H81_000691 [Sphagnurus paluster]|uniref:Protein Zds1 C-terminal domain-containing protein n=1 Tax=Sphagnurus paluster TaxID=117069 RepID=A0A9P7GP33_9AGAR|nr:hypothetical protein H0H81_000691 [Sphagnurus paluster]
MSTREADRIASAQQTLDSGSLFLVHLDQATLSFTVLFEMSQLLNTQLDKETLATCVGMVESGANPEALAAVIQELRRESAALAQTLDAVGEGNDHSHRLLSFAVVCLDPYWHLSQDLPHCPAFSAMATRTLQPSEYEIQREVEALRDIRRRSTTPGALVIDPDLPIQASPTAPTSYRLATSSDESSFDSTSSSPSGSSEGPPSTPNNPTDDPFHLFWVPASLHPEIAPAEFRAFLKEHARSPPASEDGSTSPGSADSLSPSSSLGRKRSMLSRQYRPDEHDGVENEHVVPLRRNRSSLYTNRGPQLTIDDLQKLEQLAEEASVNDDPSRLRNVLRRSLSLNVSPSAMGLMEEMPEMLDEADVPIIVPPPGQILRRTARTKIRKPGLPGDGGGHRFGSSRRGMPTRNATAPAEPRTSSDISSSDHGESLESNSLDRRSRPFSEEGLNQRPDSYSEETSIFDAYVRDDDDEEILPPVVITSSPPSLVTELPEEPQPPPEALLEALGPVIHHPQPQHLLSPQPPTEQTASRTPSPSEPVILVDHPPPTHSPPSVQSTTPSPPPQHRKEKDKKGLFGKWGGGDKGGKKAKHKDAESRERAAEKEKEKDTGFFGSLFGSKKKQDETPPPLLSPGHPGREAAHALLGASKSKSFTSSPTSPIFPTGVTPNNYSRYPIHVERAIYRLSHIKLANPRRPLYEQVLISNLMFWYLGVINKAQNPQPSPNGQAATTQVPTGAVDAQQAEEKDVEKERKEREQQELRERAEKERIEKERQERLEREQREREIELKKKDSGRKGSLTKAPAPGMPGGGGRRAEMPVKGPQYEMQHRVMEQEYGGYNGQSQQGLPIGRSASAPVATGNGSQYTRISQSSPSSQYNSPPKLVQPQPQHPGDQYYYSPELPHNQGQQPRLPPGAKPPDQQTWQQQAPRSQTSPSPPTSPDHHRSRSPPTRNSGHARYDPSASQDSLILDGRDRVPGRSLSATAVSSQTMTNGKIRKGTSAHAVAPSHNRRPRTSEGRQAVEQNGNGEEEDMPLAMWQQQRRR